VHNIIPKLALVASKVLLSDCSKLKFISLPISAMDLVDLTSSHALVPFEKNKMKFSNLVQLRNASLKIY
jgi:hypothetical protein